jgi:hypothetical protein
MEHHGYTTTAIGQLWALGVFAEIGVFLLIPVLLPRFGARRLLLIAIALTTLRWLLTALFADNLAIMIFSQTLHAASFGLYHAVMILLIHSLFTGSHQGRGQCRRRDRGTGQRLPVDRNEPACNVFYGRTDQPGCTAGGIFLCQEYPRELQGMNGFIVQLLYTLAFDSLHG